MRKADRLLILSCSQQKREDTDLLPAILRYDGPLYRVYRRFQQEYPALAPDVYIVSAKFGLILGTHPLPYYDQKMTRQRASHLAPMVSEQLSSLLLTKRPGEVFVCVGQEYLRAMGAVRWGTTPVFASGSIGKRQAELKNWLYAASHLEKRNNVNGRRQPSICGTTITQTPDEAMRIVRQALATRKNIPSACHFWYVQIDDQRVGPKWLVSQLTGIPVQRFHTEAAVRALTRLGIEVGHV